MNINTDLLKTWDACADGYKWFVKNFPDGSDYAATQTQLRKQAKYDWSVWLTDRVWKDALAEPAKFAALTAAEIKQALVETKDSPNTSSGNYSKAASSGDGSKAASSGDGSKAASSGYGSKAASSGDYSTAASSGDYSTAASSGNYSTAASSGDGSKAASSGYGSKAASSGDYSTAASSGNYSTAASSGNYSTAASSGNYSTAASSGENTIAMVAGDRGQAKAGPNGCIALCWFDGKRNRIVTGYVGEDIDADTLYRVEAGKLVKV